VIVDEPVRGSVPPPWFWALPGIERVRAFSSSHLPVPPLLHLVGIRPAHVGPGSGIRMMPATGWLQDPMERLEVAMLAEAAATGVAMTMLPPGIDVEPVSPWKSLGYCAVNRYFRTCSSNAASQDRLAQPVQILVRAVGRWVTTTE